MTPPAGSDDRSLTLETLEDLRAHLASDQTYHKSLPSVARSLLQPLLAETASAPDNRLRTAMRRLALMAEVWDCLTADDDTVEDNVKPFYRAALDSLISGLSTGAEEQAVGDALGRIPRAARSSPRTHTRRPRLERHLRRRDGPRR
jgi:hypothetical protein